MMSENGHIEIFERYRNGELSEAEQRDFEARLVYDSELKEAFEEYEQIEVGIKNHFRNKLKTKLQDLDQQMDTTPKKTNVLKLVVWTSSIAAAVVLGCFILQHFTHPNNIQLAEQYWPHEEGLPVKMSTKGKYDDAMNAFKLENWEQAERLLLKIDSDTSDYFLGIINYQQKEYRQSKSYFMNVSNESIYFYEAQFRLALVSILTNDIGSSKVVLRKLIEKDNEYNEQAKKLLSELE